MNGKYLVLTEQHHRYSSPEDNTVSPSREGGAGTWHVPLSCDRPIGWLSRHPVLFPTEGQDTGLEPSRHMRVRGWMSWEPSLMHTIPWLVLGCLCTHLLTLDLLKGGTVPQCDSTPHPPTSHA